MQRLEVCYSLNNVVSTQQLRSMGASSCDLQPKTVLLDSEKVPIVLATCLGIRYYW